MLMESDKECDGTIAEESRMDTVPIFRDLRISMEAILSRDQRTTSHRVIERGAQSSCNALSFCQNGSVASGWSRKFGSVSSTSEEGETRATVTCRTNASENTDRSTDTARKLQTEDIVESLRRDTHRCRYNCQCEIPGARKFSTRANDERRESAFAPRRRPSMSRRGNNSTTWLRLSSVLLAFFIISVQGAPMTMNPEDRRLSSPPKWVNPCGLAAEDFYGDLDVVQLKDEQLLRQVVVQAKTALGHAELFRDNYISRTFSTGFKELRNDWKDSHYDWLPGPNKIPKQLGERLSQEYLNKVEISLLDEVLLDAYEYMQRYAVGLEQIVWDQEDYNLEFLRQFKETEFNLRTVLCELQVALVERGVTPRPDIQRDAMSSEFRSMAGSETHRNLRDWLIFRDYMNGLEYIVQVFDHLRRTLES